MKPVLSRAQVFLIVALVKPIDATTATALETAATAGTPDWTTFFAALATFISSPAGQQLLSLIISLIAGGG